jgi:hypothetical protein
MRTTWGVSWGLLGSKSAHAFWLARPHRVTRGAVPSTAMTGIAAEKPPSVTRGENGGIASGGSALRG